MFVSAPAGQVLRDDEVVDREREDDGGAREDGGSEQRQEYAEEPVSGWGAEVGGRLLVVAADRDEAAAHDHDDVRERERHLADRLGPACRAR